MNALFLYKVTHKKIPVGLLPQRGYMLKIQN